MKKILVLLLVLSVLIDYSYSSDKFLYLEILISKNEDVKITANYFLDFANENYLNSGNIKVVCYDSSNNVLKIVYLNYSKEEFFQEVFSIKRGKEIIEKDYIIKSLVFKFPENTTLIKIFISDKEKAKLVLLNQTLKVLENESTETPGEKIKEERKYSYPNHLAIIIFLTFLIVIIFIILKLIKRHRAP